MLISDDFTEITKKVGESHLPPHYVWHLTDEKAVIKSLSLGRGAELVEAERGYAENNAIRKHNGCKQKISVCEFSSI